MSPRANKTFRDAGVLQSYTTVLSEGLLVQSTLELSVMLFSDSLGVSGDTSRVLLSMESSRSSRGGGGVAACSE